VHLCVANCVNNVKEIYDCETLGCFRYCRIHITLHYVKMLYILLILFSNNFKSYAPFWRFHNVQVISLRSHSKSVQNGTIGRVKHPSKIRLVAIYCLSIEYPFCFFILKVSLFLFTKKLKGLRIFDPSTEDSQALSMSHWSLEKRNQTLPPDHLLPVNRRHPSATARILKHPSPPSTPNPLIQTGWFAIVNL
jgi:hypothetical protein